MSSENYLRTEQVHIDEIDRKATSTVQWFAEVKNKRGKATHPITHNNRLTVHICGKDGFAAIAKDIAEAKESIDLVCWGFDPGMELVRHGYTWPRAETYGDLLIAAGRRGAQVQLLVWHSLSGGVLQKHMPGYTHGKSPWRTLEGDLEVQQIHSKRSLQLVLEHARVNRHKKDWNLSGDQLAAMAREEYCCSWYKAAFAGRLKGICVRTRDGDSARIKDSLRRETRKPDAVESKLFTLGGTHHQKTILIDFSYKSGEKAVGYVMGLNSLTDYWDTPEHCVENPLREQGSDKTKHEHAEDVDGYYDFATLKPYRDYACRIDGGQALIPLHENFERAWKRAGGGDKGTPYVCAAPPSALLRKPQVGDSTVQIARTQPEEDDFTIRDIYFNATRVAATGAGYLYMENQYFQYQDWAEHLLAVRKKVVAAWNRGCEKIGKTREDLPVMHTFVVIPAPEKKQMVPRTHDTLATLGQQNAMIGQVKMIEAANIRDKAIAQGLTSKMTLYQKAAQRAEAVAQSLTDVISTANMTEKPSELVLKKIYGVRVCVAALNNWEFNKVLRQFRYREIYIHSKLLLIDDGFFTLGSANLNQRSMAADSEINVVTNDALHACSLRKRIWSQIAGDELSGGAGSPNEMQKTFFDWVKLMNINRERQKALSTDPKRKEMTGFLVSLRDERSSTIRYG